MHNCQFKSNQISITDIYESIQTMNPHSIVLQGSHLLLNSVYGDNLFVLYKIKDNKYDNYHKHYLRYQLSHFDFKSGYWKNIEISPMLHVFFQSFGEQIYNNKDEDLLKCAILKRNKLIILDIQNQILLNILINYKTAQVTSIKYLETAITYDIGDDGKLLILMTNLKVIEQELYLLGFNNKKSKMHILKYNEYADTFTLCHEAYVSLKDTFSFWRQKKGVTYFKIFCSHTSMYYSEKLSKLFVLMWSNLFDMELTCYDLKLNGSSKCIKLNSGGIKIENIPPVYSGNELINFLFKSGSTIQSIAFDYTIRSKFKFFLSPWEIVFFDLYCLTIHLFLVKKQKFMKSNSNLLKNLEINYDPSKGEEEEQVRLEIMILTRNVDETNKLCTGYVRNSEEKFGLSIPFVMINFIIEYYIHQMIKLINNNPSRFAKDCFKSYTFNADLIYQSS